MRSQLTRASRHLQGRPRWLIGSFSPRSRIDRRELGQRDRRCSDDVIGVGGEEDKGIMQ